MDYGQKKENQNLIVETLKRPLKMEKLKELTLAIVSGELLSDWVIGAILVAYLQEEITLEQRKKLTHTAWVCGLIDKMYKKAKWDDQPSEEDVRKAELEWNLNRPKDPVRRLLLHFETTKRDDRFLLSFATNETEGGTPVTTQEKLIKPKLKLV